MDVVGPEDVESYDFPERRKANSAGEDSSKKNRETADGRHFTCK